MRDFSLNLRAKIPKMLGDKCRSSKFAVRKIRMLMDVPSPCDDCGLNGGYLIMKIRTCRRAGPLSMTED